MIVFDIIFIILVNIAKYFRYLIMHNIVDNLLFIESELKTNIEKLRFQNYFPKIIAVLAVILLGVLSL